MRLVLLAALAAVGLSGCYVSKRPLLDARQALHPIAVGSFQNPDDKGGVLDISDAGGGWYRIYEIGDNEASQVMFTPLPGQDRVMAMAWSEKRGYLYGLAYPGDDGQVHVSGVSCDAAAARRAAEAHKAKIAQQSGSTVCEFTSRAALVAAMADYAKSWDWKTATMRLPASGEIGPNPAPAPSVRPAVQPEHPVRSQT